MKEGATMEIRYFEPEDAKRVLSWITSEREFRMWSADQYGDYPIRPEDIVENYKNKIKNEEFYPLIFEEKGRVIGHLILRYNTSDKKNVRLGFIIVDNKKRNKGKGTQMIYSAMRYAANNLGAIRFNLGVFTNNDKARKCYERIGFKPTKLKKQMLKFHDEEWDWVEMLYDPTDEIINCVNKHISKIIEDLS